MANNTENTDRASTKLVRLWDPLLRVLHWSLAFCVIAAWGLAKFGPNVMTLHFYFGYATIALLAIRLIWGFVGPRPARFTSFTYGPTTMVRYLRTIRLRRPSYWPGHNPVGALSVFALLAMLIFQTSTGLFVDADDYINAGPLASAVDSATNRRMTQLHHFSGTIIGILVALHIGAVLFYRFYKRENLIKPMITGWKEVRDRAE